MSTETSVEEFVESLAEDTRDRMEEMVNQYYNEEYFDSLGSPEDVIRSEFPWRSWREMFFGCHPPCRQVYLIYEQGEPWTRDRDLIVGLFKQVRDEFKHARIYSNLAREFGAEVDLATYNPMSEEELVEMGRRSVEWDKPHHIVAGFQNGTEIQALYMTDNLADYLEPHYPDISASLRSISKDEGDHIHVGRLIAKRFSTPDDVEAMKEANRLKSEASLAAVKAHTGN